MKPDQLYHELQILAEKLGLQVSEHNFKTAGIHVRSGYCIVKDQPCCIIDKSLKAAKKAEALAECLSQMPHESVFVVPAIREYLEQFKPVQPPKPDKEEEAEAQEATRIQSNSENPMPG